MRSHVIFFKPINCNKQTNIEDSIFRLYRSRSRSLSLLYYFSIICLVLWQQVLVMVGLCQHIIAFAVCVCFECRINRSNIQTVNLCLCATFSQRPISNQPIKFQTTAVNHAHHTLNCPENVTIIFPHSLHQDEPIFLIRSKHFRSCSVRFSISVSVFLLLLLFCFVFCSSSSSFFSSLRFVSILFTSFFTTFAKWKHSFQMERTLSNKICSTFAQHPLCLTSRSCSKLQSFVGLHIHCFFSRFFFCVCVSFLHYFNFV